MNRTEAITQLNQERKRKENLVWEAWFVTENNNQVTSERLIKRTSALTQIRDEYEKALAAINNQSIASQTETFTQISGGASQKEQPRQNIQKKALKNVVLAGAENLAENKPIDLGQTPQRRSIDGIQNNPNEPEIVRDAREQNRSEQIREAEEKTQESEDIERQGIYSKNQENTAEIKKDNSQLSNLECFLLLLIGIVADLINLIPFVNILITLFVTPALALYFRIRKVSLAPTITAGLLELIPVLSIIPGITLGIIVTIVFNRFKSKALEKIPFASTIIRK